VGAHAKQSNGAVCGNSALYQNLEKLNLKVPEGTKFRGLEENT